MTGRELVFSDPVVIKIVTESFVPVAENVSGMQSSDDEKGRFFREVAVQGRMKGRSRPGVSHQGIYAFTADGTSLASGNPLEADRTLELLRDTLAEWERRGRHHGPPRLFPAGVDGDAGYPEDGTILRLTARDLPRSSGSSFPDGQERFARTWNSDFVWIQRCDATSLLPASLAVGESRDVPQPLLRRLARFHLRDIVRGEPWVWGPDSVRHIRLTSTVVDRIWSNVTLALRGKVVLREHVEFRDAHEPVDWTFDNELDASIRGEATWDEADDTFAAFDLLVAGQRAGACRYNVRTGDPGPAPIGFSLELAGDTPWERTPPHVIRTWTSTGDPNRPATTITGEPYFGEPVIVEGPNT